MLVVTAIVTAIVTTLMPAPLFELVYGRKARAGGELGRLNGEEDGGPAEEAARSR